MFRFKKKLIAKFKSLLFLMIKEIQSMSKNLKSVITCDLDGKIETFSEGAQQLFGYTENEILVKDEWVFERKIHNNNLNWTLVETKSN